MHTEMNRPKFKRPIMKPLAERNRFAVGLIGIAVLVAAVVAAFYGWVFQATFRRYPGGELGDGGVHV